ncbi:uncharacterized protein LOC122320512 [Drosophila ficusphila]|uniref:uncharacterized protein LOC122320512 n=1 Tax=Drosophila ficusphila TaxID=30025 RepID=UPI001C897FDE|nr:uncharacterized protein LOC122320512 [Drosophila ficusphila]
MGKKTKEIDPDLRKLIVKLRDEGKTLREIGKIVGRAHSSIQRVLENFDLNGSIRSKPRSGRPPKLTDREKRDVLKSVKLNPRLTAFKITQDIKEKFNKDLHEDTIRKILKKEDLHARTARKKPLISPANKRKRTDFAKKFVQEPAVFWNKVLFSDE